MSEDLEQILQQVKEAGKDTHKLSAVLRPSIDVGVRLEFDDFIEDADAEELEAYIELMTFGINADNKDLKAHFRQEYLPPDQDPILLPITSEIVRAVPRFRERLKDPKIRDTYKQAISAADTVDACTLIARALPEFLPLMARKNQGEIYRRVVETACEKARTSCEPFPISYMLLTESLPYLESVARKAETKRFFERVKETHPADLQEFMISEFSTMRKLRSDSTTELEDPAYPVGISTIGDVSRSTFERMEEALSKKDETVKAKYHAMLNRYAKKRLYNIAFMQRIIEGSEDLIGATIPYVECLSPEDLQKYLDLITDNLHNAPRDMNRWLEIGLKAVRKFGDKAEKYFKYALKPDDMDPKIDELSAMEIIIDKYSPHTENEVFVTDNVLHVRPEKDVKKALRETARIVAFFSHIDKIKRSPPQLLPKGAEDISRRYPEYASFVGPLLRSKRNLFQRTQKDIPIKYRMFKDGINEPLNIAHEPSYQSPLERLQSEIDFFNVTATQLRHGWPKEFKTAREFLDNALSPSFAIDILNYIRNDPILRNKGLEFLKDKINNLETRLSAMDEFDELRVEINACFLDDLIDRTGACISTNGSQREATLVYLIDNDTKNNKNTDTLSINAYHRGRFICCLGKVLLVDVIDKKDNQRKLLVDGVIMGPDLAQVRAQTTKHLYDWYLTVARGIERYAKNRGYEKVLVNTHHSAGQQCTHHFTEMVAERTNQESQTGEEINYKMVLENGISTFHLQKSPHKTARVKYTHQIAKRPISPEIIQKVGKNSWQGESYFDTWYEFNNEEVWNRGEGKATLIEVPVKYLGDDIPF